MPNISISTQCYNYSYSYNWGGAPAYVVVNHAILALSISM